MAIGFRQVGLIAKNSDQRVVETLEALGELLAGSDVAFALDSVTAEGLERWRHPVASMDELAARCDLVIVVGGDGTLLNTVRHFAARPIPLVGINLGRLGFLTDIPANRATEDVHGILHGEYDRDERAMLHGRIQSGNETRSEDIALNDVVLHKADGGRMIEFETWVNGAFVSLHRADGMVAATATGSTAYALSGGGPILHPSLGGLTLVPICPHTLSDRPLVIPDNAEVEFVLRGDPDGEGQVHWDGQKTAGMRAGDCLRIRRAEQATTLLHPPGYDYFALLRSKLHWGRAQDGGVPR